MSYDFFDYGCCNVVLVSGVVVVFGLVGCVGVVFDFIFKECCMSMLVICNVCIIIFDSWQLYVQVLVVQEGCIVVVGSDEEIMCGWGNEVMLIDVQGWCLLFGFNDSYIYFICGGLNYNLELCWDGLCLLGDVLDMLKVQVDCIFVLQWVCVVGGFIVVQFNEKCLLMLQEFNDIVLDMLVFLLYLYDCVLFNCVVLCVCGYIKDMLDLLGGQIVCDLLGNLIGLLLVKFNVLILYVMLVKGLCLLIEYQVNLMCYFMCELNWFGIILVIDVGGGFQNYFEDYQVIEQLYCDDQLMVCIVYNLFIQNKGREVDDFCGWSEILQLCQGDDLLCYNGVGEMLVFFVVDFELFNELCLELLVELEFELYDVVKLLVEKCWLFCIYVIYDESIICIFDVYEQVNCEVLFDGLYWFIDYVEIIILCNIECICVLGGGIVVQYCMVYQGEVFVECYGVQVVWYMLLVKCMLVEGVLVGVGIDVICVVSYNLWVVLFWLVIGCIVGGLVLYGEENLFECEQVLCLWIQGSVWFFGDEVVKGMLKVGQLVDFILFLVDFFCVDDVQIVDIISVLMVVGGCIVYVDVDYVGLVLQLLLVMLDWLLVNCFGGYYVGGVVIGLIVVYCYYYGVVCSMYGVYGYVVQYVVFIGDLIVFWGVMGCLCFVF